MLTRTLNRQKINMATVYPKDYFQQVTNKVQRASCFVLMPFDDKFKEVYEIIKESLESEEINLECNRADEFHQPHIIETILKRIVQSEYIIADLTESNANVFYELGLVHSVKDIDKVIILTQNMKFVPFDLRQFRCITYEQSITGSKKLKKELIKTFKEASKDTFRFKIKENRITPFDKRLVGKDNYIYELKFECPFIGHDGVKMQIHFTQLAVDRTVKVLETQFLYLSLDKQTDKIENIPWNVSLIKTDDSSREAVISIDKR